MSYTREKVLFIFDKFPFIEVYKDDDTNQRYISFWLDYISDVTKDIYMVREISTSQIILLLENKIKLIDVFKNMYTKVIWKDRYSEDTTVIRMQDIYLKHLPDNKFEFDTNEFESYIIELKDEMLNSLDRDTVINTIKIIELELYNSDSDIYRCIKGQELHVNVDNIKEWFNDYKVELFKRSIERVK